MAAAGLFLAITVIASGVLLTWAHTFIGNEVHTQLAAQQIYFPPANSKAVAAPEFAAMRQYGGQQLTTGAQAQVYADHFIANHLKEIGGGKTYAQLSAAALAQPKNTVLAAQVATVFKGETLRGLLLNAYAFGTMGMIAGIAAIAAFIAGAVMLVLSGLGLMHARRTSPATEILSGHPANGRTPSPHRRRPTRAELSPAPGGAGRSKRHLYDLLFTGLRRLHVTSGFTPGIVLADVLLPSRHRPVETRERRRRPRRSQARDPRGPVRMPRWLGRDRGRSHIQADQIIGTDSGVATWCGRWPGRSGHR